MSRASRAVGDKQSSCARPRIQNHAFMSYFGTGSTETLHYKVLALVVGLS